LFGIKKGAYTGASDQKGLIEKAHEGILFLDEWCIFRKLFNFNCIFVH